MKVLIICSKTFYARIPEVKAQLESDGHKVFLPNCYDKPETEARLRGTADHSTFKAQMFRNSEATISNMDAVLVLNYEKNGSANYIGGATFLEMYDAFRLQKRIFLLNPIPKGILEDEIIGFSPIVLNGKTELL